jgi:hypothetical protein
MRSALLRSLASLLLLAKPTRADGLYLGVSGHGVMYFDGRRVRTVTKTPELPLVLTSESQGSLWIGRPLGVVHIVEGKPTETDPLAVALFMTAKRGVVWFANEKEVAWHANAWHTLALPDSAGAILEDFTVDDTSRAWILRGGALSYTDGTTWTGFSLPVGRTDAKGCRVVSAGDLHLVCWDAWFRLHDGKWSVVAGLDKVVPEHVQVATDGTLYMIGFSSSTFRVFVISPDGTSTHFPLPKGWTATTAFEVDARGHIWIGSVQGLIAFDHTGTALKLPRGLPTRQEIGSLLIDGAGPAL